MRGRHENCEWIHPFNPQYPYYEYMYREANAWQVSFYVPHDMPGLAELYGGKQNFEEKLDSLFKIPWNHRDIARNVSSFVGQYCNGNHIGSASWRERVCTDVSIWAVAVSLKENSIRHRLEDRSTLSWVI